MLAARKRSFLVAWLAISIGPFLGTLPASAGLPDREICDEYRADNGAAGRLGASGNCSVQITSPTGTVYEPGGGIFAYVTLEEFAQSDVADVWVSYASPNPERSTSEGAIYGGSPAFPLGSVCTDAPDAHTSARVSPFTNVGPPGVGGSVRIFGKGKRHILRFEFDEDAPLSCHFAELGDQCRSSINSGSGRSVVTSPAIGVVTDDLDNRGANGCSRFFYFDLVTDDDLTVTAFAAPSKINLGDEFEVRVRVRNTGFHPLSQVVPTVVPQSEDGGKVFRLEGPIPASFEPLPRFESTLFTYRFRSDAVGHVTFDAAATGQGNGILRESNATSSPAVELVAPIRTTLTLEPAEMTIADWRGEDEHTFERDPAEATLYGRTVVPVTVLVEEVSGVGIPLEGESVRIHAQPKRGEDDFAVSADHFGFALDPSAPGPDFIDVVTDENGEATVFFHLEDLFANVGDDEEDNATSIEITATRTGDTPVTENLAVVDNRERILQRYSIATEYIPDGARSVWRDAYLPPLRGGVSDLVGGLLSSIVQPGNSGLGTFFCNSYQRRVLLFLNEIRHSDDGWLLQGLDYAPLQTVHTDHHFVGLYPSSLSFDSLRAMILDPWLPQTIAAYSWQEWIIFMDPFGQGDNVRTDDSMDPNNPGTCVVQCGEGNFVPLPYPALGGHYPWFPENAGLPIEAVGGQPQQYDACLAFPPDYCARNGFEGIAASRSPAAASDHATVVVGSPVTFLVTMEDGRRYGYAPEDLETFLNEFGDDFDAAHLEIPEADGERGVYIDLPPGQRFTLSFPGEADGVMSLAILTKDGTIWGAYRDIPVVGGETNTVPVDLDEPCANISSSSETTVDCVQSIDGTSCGDPNADKRITASDALLALRAAVLVIECDLFVCDVNRSDRVTASDALAILRYAVGVPIAMQCPIL